MFKALLPLAMLLLFSGFFRVSECSNIELKTSVMSYIKSVPCKAHGMAVIGKGSLDGLFSYDDIWLVYDQLKRLHPEIVGDRISIGKTVEGRTIDSFYIGSNTSDETDKNIILIDALHHSREFVTLSMIVEIMLDSVKRASGRCKDAFFENNRLL